MTNTNSSLRRKDQFAQYNALGIMSGTSLDGLDLAAVRFEIENGQWNYQLLDATTIDYDEEWKNKLTSANLLTGSELVCLHHSYGQWIGKQAANFLGKNDIETDLICSHGHTVHHQPGNGFTFQIGHGQEIANISNITTICDFRTMDVTLGGQGAPLVPIGDQYLFSDFDYCLNIGGIANVSFEQRKRRISYDICFANMALNFIAKTMGKAYDDKGAIARSGHINTDLLNQLNRLSFIHQSGPRSLGFEEFQSELKPLIEQSNLGPADILNTLVEHIAQAIVQPIKTDQHTKKSMVVTGGGALNEYLIERMVHHANGRINVVIPEKSIIQFKEAIIFGLLGVLRWRNEINCLASVTGASRDSSGGVIFKPAY